MSTQGPRYHYDVSVDRDWTASSSLGGRRIEREEPWLAEHFVLVGLVRCTLASLDHSARRAGLEVTAQGRAHGTVARREEDELYAFVEIESSYEVEVSGRPGREVIAELLARAERGCFVGNSLTPRPSYRWTVNGEKVA